MDDLNEVSHAWEAVQRARAEFTAYVVPAITDTRARDGVTVDLPRNQLADAEQQLELLVGHTIAADSAAGAGFPRTEHEPGQR